MDEEDVGGFEAKGGVGFVDGGEVVAARVFVDELFDHDAVVFVFDDDFVAGVDFVVGFDDDEFAVFDAGFHGVAYTAQGVGVGVFGGPFDGAFADSNGVFEFGKVAVLVTEFGAADDGYALADGGGRGVARRDERGEDGAAFESQAVFNVGGGFFAEGFARVEVLGDAAFADA